MRSEESVAHKNARARPSLPSLVAPPKRMDERLHEFPSLFELDLSSNNLDTIENVPDAVQLLNAFSNKITELAVASQPPQPSLLHLGLGFNRVRDVTSHLPAAYPNLISLDLSYNCIIDISPLMLVLARACTCVLLVGNPVLPQAVPPFRDFGARPKAAAR